MSEQANNQPGADPVFLRAGEAEALRLVRAPKNRTRKFEPISEHDAGEFDRRAGCFTVLQSREWSGEFRVRTRVEASMQKPPTPEGARASELLSDRGARKIADSCLYMALKKGGYKTFITGTFDQEARQRIKREFFRAMAIEGADGPCTAVGFDDGVMVPIELVRESSIQKEVTRSMDAIKKMYMRGWVRKDGRYVPSCAPTIKRKEGRVRAGRQGLYTPIEYVREGLCYCWVVEIPENAEGEDNPHVHIMMNWRIGREHWEDWRERLEAVWGNGYFHLEKIEKPEQAGAYMAKAAGYLSKGRDDNGQGFVVGNRYSISEPARAPEWCTVGEYELGVMGRLIADLHDGMTHKYGDLYAERKRLNESLESVPRAKKKLRHRIGEKLAQVRKRVNAIPVRASKYQVVLKGEKCFARFLGWAQALGWNPDKRPATRWLVEFNKSLYNRRKRREFRYRNSWWFEEWLCLRGIYEREASIRQPDDRGGALWLEYQGLAV